MPVLDVDRSPVFDLAQRATHDFSRRARCGGHVRLGELIQVSYCASLEYELGNALGPLKKREIFDELSEVADATRQKMDQPEC